MITSKVTNAQTTIPPLVRSALKIEDGDEIGYLIADDHVILTKVLPNPTDDPFAAFGEWESEADRIAYGNL